MLVYMEKKDRGRGYNMFFMQVAKTARQAAG